jgi:hypothetical protein
VTVEGSAALGNQQGLELGFSAEGMRVEVRDTVFAGNGVGVRLGDNYDWSRVAGTLDVRGARFAENVWRDVLDLSRAACGPAARPGQLRVEGAREPDGGVPSRRGGKRRGPLDGAPDLGRAERGRAAASPWPATSLDELPGGAAGGLPPETHGLILWSGAPAAEKKRVEGFLRAGRAVHGLSLLARVRVAPDRSKGRFDEEWFRAFYGEGYYPIFHAQRRADAAENETADPANLAGAPVRVPMTQHKGDGAFTVYLLRDDAPRGASSPARSRIVALKETVRAWMPRRFVVHASATRAEAARDAAFLFGVGAPESAAGVWTRDASSRFVPRVPRAGPAEGPGGGHVGPADARAAGRPTFPTPALLSARWDASLGVAVLLGPEGAARGVGAAAAVAAMLRSEWPRVAVDVEEVRDRLARVVARPDLGSAAENAVRAALLGRARMPVLLHLPVDVRFGRAVVRWRALGAMRLLRAAGWPAGLQCATVEDAWALVGRRRESQTSPDGGSHAARIRALFDAIGRAACGGGADGDGGDELGELVAVRGTGGGPGGHSKCAAATLVDGNHRAVALYGLSVSGACPADARVVVHLGESASLDARVQPRGSFFCSEGCLEAGACAH